MIKYLPPSNLKLYFAGLGQLINSHLPPVSAPARLGAYRLVKEIARADAMPNYTFGIYQRARSRVFIKTWHGGWRDLNYYFLRTEISLSQILDHYKTATIRLPKLLEVIDTGHSLSAVYEYVAGRHLDSLAPTAQAATIHRIVRWLARVSAHIPPADRVYVPRRGLESYLILLPLITTLLVIRRPNYTLPILQATYRAFASLFHYFGRPVVLNYRDLTPDNLLVKRGVIYLLDIESMAYTLPGYDPAFISAQRLPQLSSLLSSRFGCVPDRGLQSYIALHHTLFSGAFFHVNLNSLSHLISDHA